jgi:Ribonuclease G/E
MAALATGAEGSPIKQTEALVAIDVNTGKHRSGKDLDSTILQVNLEGLYFEVLNATNLRAFN